MRSGALVIHKHMPTLPNCSTSTNIERKGNSCLLCSYPQGLEKAIPASSVFYSESSIGARKGCPKIPPACAAKLLQPELLGSSQGLGAQCPQAAHLYSLLRSRANSPALPWHCCRQQADLSPDPHSDIWPPPGPGWMEIQHHPGSKTFRCQKTVFFASR